MYGIIKDVAVDILTQSLFFITFSLSDIRIE